MEPKKELYWSEKKLGKPTRNGLWWDKFGVETFTAEDSFWELHDNVAGGPGDGFGLLSFGFEGLLYRIYVVGPACAFRPTPEDPEAEFLESHEWNTWEELMETIRWKNGKTLSEMMRTVHWSVLEYEQYDVPERYVPKPKNTPES